MTQTTARDESYSFRNRRGFLSHPPAAFELGWREHAQAGQAERGVAALGVVVGLDEVEDRASSLVSSPKDLPVEQLTLEGGEEALGHRVVEAIAAAAHRLDEACLANASTVGQARVLTALIRMSDGALGLAATDSHFESLNH